MKFCIITPTFKRPDKLRRAINSVITQTLPDWEMLVINDNPGDSTYTLLASFVDGRIKFLENAKNEGVNFSRNKGLNAISNDVTHVVFLDDDDYLEPQALQNIADIVTEIKCSWLITSRGTSLSLSTTFTPNTQGTVTYAWDYLILKRIKGDATHCIDVSLLNHKDSLVRFPTHIRQAEEWIFYLELSQLAKMFYRNTVTTLTEDYTDTGLNNRKRTVSEQLHTLQLIYREAQERKLIFTFSFWIYLFMRVMRVFIK